MGQTHVLSNEIWFRARIISTDQFLLFKAIALTLYIISISDDWISKFFKSCPFFLILENIFIKKG